ncbi:histidine kinase [Rhodospirillum rubrum]|uniref:ATP-binding protein n=1 Tax=Rhodospirillum rubrum TaxID=1085 RepID=UPI001906171A|nr:ATP-binding protein [Rhodospirillum rubrum]MBK1664575.1 histidine kinase [Rhodospirillum rubrum]MBK1676746.1 histidine kinase [Rhodospirillum rubrum]
METVHSTCDQEPIHVPGLVQPHGFLVVLESKSGRIAQVTQGIEAVAGVVAEDLIGEALERVLDPGSAQKCRHRIARPDYPHLIDPFPVTSLTGRSFSAVAHATDQADLVELWSDDQEITVEGVFGRLPFAIGHASRAASVEDLCERAAATVADLTGYERVMVYRFAENWEGEVIAEALSGSVESYKGQRFPASDIPAQARALYGRNLLRSIPDVGYRPLPLVGRSPDGRALDMTFCNLRSVSPVHLEYLRNMGVAASFSVSLVVDGRLWGLVACHDRVPRRLSLATMGACQVYAETIAQQVLRLDNARRSRHRSRTGDLIDDISVLLGSGRSLGEALDYTLDETLALFGASRAVISLDGRQWSVDGPLEGAPIQMPPHQRLLLSERLANRVRLPTDLAADFVGAVFLPLSDQPDRDFLLLGRPETLRSIEWAGRPEKQPEISPEGVLKIHPRTSFSLWREEVRGRSAAFDPLDRETAETLSLFLAERLAKQRRQQAVVALEETRQRLRDLAECSSDWLWETAADGTLALVSDRITGLGDLRPEELLGRKLVDLVGGGDGGGAPGVDADEIASAFDEGRAFHGLTVSLALLGRGQWWVRLSGVPQYDGRGRLLGFRGTGTDVTPFKRLQEERIRTQRLEALGRLASGIAHEIGNVLQPVLTMAHYASKRLDDRAFLEAALADIVEGGARAKDIVRSILTFARQTPAERRPLVLAPALARSVAFAAKGHPGLEIITDIPDTAREIAANGTELSQIVLNLIGNAADAMGGRGRVFVSLAEAPDPERMVITIRDEGPGMTLQTQARAFEPFFTTKPEGSGTGMGLAVVHGLVEAWGGTIGLESAPGSGTKFVISFPINNP